MAVGAAERHPRVTVRSSRPSLPLVAACLVRSDSPRLLRNWRVCHPVVTDCDCAPAFLAGCGTRSARHAAPLFRDGRTASTKMPRGQSNSDAPSAATERPCAARLWESRRRHEQRNRRRVPAPPSDGRERERNLVERARPRSQGPRAREDGAERTHAPWWSERVRAAMGPREREDEWGAHSRAQ